MKNKTKIIVTGKNGQLARTIMSNFKNKFIVKSYDKKKIDITKKSDLLKLNLKGVSILINTAAYNDVEKSEKKNKLANKVNFVALKSLKEICDKNNIFLIHFSTDYVFDGKKKSYSENDVANPINEYGKSKARGEQFLLKSKLNNYVIIRLSWVYSPVGKNFLNKIINLLKIKDNLSVVNDQYGVPTSTRFIAFYLKKLIKRIMQKDKIDKIYHLAPNGKTSWYKFALMILGALKTKYPSQMNKKKILPIISNFKGKPKRPVCSKLNSLSIQKKLDVKFKNWEYYFLKEFK